MSSSQQPTTKKFQKGERSVPHASQKAKKFYSVEKSEPSKGWKPSRETKLRPSLQPGTVLILLAGRFRGKRVICLKHLGHGVLLVTGPFKLNGVPLRRVNARYVIATSTKVDVKSVDQKLLEKVGSDEYIKKDKASKKAGEEAFFKQGEKPEKKPVDSSRAEDQKAVDKGILANIKKDKMLGDYLGASFSLRKGDKPHEMVF